MTGKQKWAILGPNNTFRYWDDLFVFPLCFILFAFAISDGYSFLLVRFSADSFCVYGVHYWRIYILCVCTFMSLNWPLVGSGSNFRDVQTDRKEWKYSPLVHPPHYIAQLDFSLPSIIYHCVYNMNYQYYPWLHWKAICILCQKCVSPSAWGRLLVSS